MLKHNTGRYSYLASHVSIVDRISKFLEKPESNETISRLASLVS